MMRKWLWISVILVLIFITIVGVYLYALVCSRDPYRVTFKEAFFEAPASAAPLFGRTMARDTQELIKWMTNIGNGNLLMAKVKPITMDDFTNTTEVPTDIERLNAILTESNRLSYKYMESKHFVLLLHSGADIPYQIFTDEMTPEQFKPFFKNFISNPQSLSKEDKLKLFSHIVLIMFEDQLSYIANEMNFSYYRLKDKKFFLIFEDKPEAEGGSCMGCGGSAGGNALSVHAQRLVPISGTYAHEFGHLLHERYDWAIGLHESFGNLFIQELFLQGKKDAYMDWVARVSRAPMRLGHWMYYYQECMIFRYIIDDPDRIGFQARFIPDWMITSAKGGDPWQLFADLLVGKQYDGQPVDYKTFLLLYYRRFVWINYPKFQATHLKSYENLTGRYDRRNTQLLYQHLIPVPDKLNAWRPMECDRPMETGYNQIPILPTSNSFSITFNGIPNTEAKSDWRWCLCIVNKETKAVRYSQVRGDKSSLTSIVNPDTEWVYLVVVAVPTDMKWHEIQDFDIDIPNRTKTMLYHPYEVTLENAVGAPHQGFDIQIKDSDYNTHPNGGGKVHKSSQVGSTAYIGPKCVIANGVSVENGAYIDGNVLVEGPNTLIGGNVFVNGCIYIKDSSTLNGYATVFDYTYLIRANVLEYARVIEKAVVNESHLKPGETPLKDFRYDSVTMKGGATAKGYASVNENIVTGTAVMDCEWGRCYHILWGSPAHPILVYGHYFGYAYWCGIGEGWGRYIEMLKALPQEQKAYFAYYDFKRISDNVQLFPVIGTVNSIIRNGTDAMIVPSFGTEAKPCLKINGTNQYIVFPRSFSQYRQVQIDMRIHVVDSALDQTVLHLGSQENGYFKFSTLTGVTAENKRNQQRFQVSLPITPLAGGWHTVNIIWTVSQCKLIIDDREQSTAVTFHLAHLTAPLSSRSGDLNYFGRGAENGGFFNGYVSYFGIKPYVEGLVINDIPPWQPGPPGAPPPATPGASPAAPPPATPSASPAARVGCIPRLRTPNS